MELEEKENLLNNYIKYLDNREKGEPMDAEVSDSLSKIREYVQTDPEFTRVIRFIDVAPDDVTKKKLIDQYINDEKNKLNELEKKGNTIRLTYNDSNFGFSSVLLLTLIVIIAFFIILFFIFN